MADAVFGMCLDNKNSSFGKCENKLVLIQLHFFFSVVERIEQKLCKLMHFFQPALASEDIYESLEKQSPHRNCSFHCCPAWRCRRTVKYQTQVNEVLAASLKPFSELGPWNLIFWKISTKLACFLTGTKCFHTTCMNALPWDLRFSFWVSENILKPLISSFPCCLPILGEISHLSSSLSKMVPQGHLWISLIWGKLEQK